jgi:quercetin dioxygenase-like cupin family protein
MNRLAPDTNDDASRLLGGALGKVYPLRTFRPNALAATSVAILALVLGGTALATLPSGQTVTLLARGTIGPIEVHHDGIEVERSDNHSADVAMATVTFDPKSSSGWHHHPGIVLVAVQSGTLTRYGPHCRKHSYSAGEAFVESNNKPGLVRNNTTSPAVVQATFIVPTNTPVTGLRIDDPQPPDCDAQ